MDNIIGFAGYMGLTGAFIITVFTIIIALLTHFKRFSGLRRLPVLLVHLQTVLLGISVAALAILLQTNAFQFEQVFTAVETLMRPMERIGGLWSGQAASLLFWSFIMSIAISLAATIGKCLDQQKQTTTIILILEFTLLFFLAPDIFVSNPFVRIFRMSNGEILSAMFAPEGAQALLPIDGQGMNPSLRHIAMLLHPPTLYIGLIGFFLPYAFALAALIHQDSSHRWIPLLFPISLFSFIFLTVGMILGSWWAYTILGWGGYWGWDAVEISGLLPWLLSFGQLHAMRLSSHRKSFNRWVYGFSFAIVNLTLFGILITRSGILDSVHSYASGPMGPILTTLILVHLSTVCFAFIRGREMFRVKRNTQKQALSIRMTRWFFWCLIGLVIIYLFGQTLPLTSQLVLGRQSAFLPADYERISAPLLFLMVLFTALCALSVYYENDRHVFWRNLATIGILSALFPITVLFYFPFSLEIVAGFWTGGFLLLSWSFALTRDILLPIFKGKTNQTWKTKIGMTLIHLGLGIMVMGIVGVETLTLSESMTLSPNIPIAFNRMEVLYDPDRSIFSEESNPSYRAGIWTVKAGQENTLMQPTIIHYVKTGTFYSVPVVRAGFLSDIQIVVDTFPASANADIDIKVGNYPLMSWIWTGGGLMALGGILPLFFRRMKR